MSTARRRSARRSGDRHRPRRTPLFETRAAGSAPMSVESSSCGMSRCFDPIRTARGEEAAPLAVTALAPNAEAFVLDVATKLVLVRHQNCVTVLVAAARHLESHSARRPVV